MEENKAKKPIDWFKLVSTVSLILTCVTIALVVFIATGMVKASMFVIYLVICLAVLCLGTLLILPWIKKLVLKKSVIISWTFFGVIVLATLLWVVAACLIISSSQTGSMTLATAQFLKIDFIFTFQFIVANFVATTILNYKKKNILFQVIAYASYLFVDFYITSLVLCIKFAPTFEINTQYLSFLFTPAMYSFLIIALIYIGIVNGIANKALARGKYKRSGFDAFANEDEDGEAYEDKAQKLEEDQKDKKELDKTKKKLEKLKNLLENNLISQEEYEKKKAEILKKI